MSVVTFGFGASAPLVLTLGFGSPAQSGSYVTLGYGESASCAAMLGLAPGVGAPGSYITFGQGQSATLFLRLGMGIGEEGQGSPGEGSPVEPPPEPEVVVWGQGYRFIFPPSNRARILRDDDDIVALILAMLQSGTLH